MRAQVTYIDSAGQAGPKTPLVTQTDLDSVISTLTARLVALETAMTTKVDTSSLTVLDSYVQGVVAGMVGGSGRPELANALNARLVASPTCQCFNPATTTSLNASIIQLRDSTAVSLNLSATQLQNISTSLSSSITQLRDTQTASLSTSIAQLQTNTNTLNSSIIQVRDSTIATLTTSMNFLNSSLIQLRESTNSNIDTIVQQNISSLSSRIMILTSDITTIQGDVSHVQYCLDRGLVFLSQLNMCVYARPYPDCPTRIPNLDSNAVLNCSSGWADSRRTDVNGSVCTATCSRGYSGAMRHYICGGDGAWSGTPIACSRE